MSVASLILCAGASSRMGEPKGLLRWRDETFLAHAVAAARGAGVANIAVVTGAHARQLGDEVRRLGGVEIQHAEWARGMGSSIKAGLAGVQNRWPDTSSLLIQLVDQPQIAAAELSRVLAAADPGRIVAAAYGGQAGAPALFPLATFADLAAINDLEGAKKLIRADRARVIRVPLPQAAFDIDTPENLADLFSSRAGS